jgi:hypothetical protein
MGGPFFGASESLSPIPSPAADSFLAQRRAKMSGGLALNYHHH